MIQFKVISQFFADVPQEDISQLHPSDLYGMVVDYWHFLQTMDDLPKVRVFNPQFEQQDWQFTHTIVSILTLYIPLFYIILNRYFSFFIAIRE